MCTIILAHGVVDGMPLLFGANRDERYSRPSAPPELVNDRDLNVVAPRDLEAGGTWLGVNEAGVLAAITNRFGAHLGADRRSRGELVFQALEHPTVEEAGRAIASLDARDFNGFHLVLASVDDARVVWGDGRTMTDSALPRGGVTVLTERSLGAARNQRKRRVKRRVDELSDAQKLGPDVLERLLSECDDGSMDATCVKMDEINYGTRSSSIIALGSSPLFRYADGPPCNLAYDDRSELLANFFRTEST